MNESEELIEVEQERLLRVRGALSNRVGALMRAWWLGMVVIEDDEDEKLFEEIVELVGEPGERRLEGDRTPLAVKVEPPLEKGLQRLSNEQYLAVFDQLMSRLSLLRRAYDRGMIIADTPEQEKQLARIRELLEQS